VEHSTHDFRGRDCSRNYFTEPPRIAFVAGACVLIHAIDTFAIARAVHTEALVFVSLAVAAFEAVQTRALVTIYPIGTRSAILARRKKLALVKIGRAIVSRVPWLAITAAIARHACNDARRCGALDVSVVFGGFLSRAPAICARLARFTLEPRRALTKIIVHEIETCSSVHAGTFRTILST
jgi:hypothetical protein